MSSIGIDEDRSGAKVVPAGADLHWARHEHPEWCDPELCGSRHGLAIHHSEPVRTAPMHSPAIRGGRVRGDGDVPGPVVRGETQVRVYTRDGKGGRRSTDVWLDVDHARQLAKALDSVADQVDQERVAAG